MNTDTVGGGEILDYVGNGQSSGGLLYMDNSVITQFGLLNIAKIIIVLLLLTLLLVIILKRLNMRSIFKSRAITNELNYVDAVRKRDAAILKANRFINNVTEIIQTTPLALSDYKRDYINYNLVRADIKTPGGNRNLDAKEFNAVIKTVQIIGVLVSILICLFVNYAAGFMLLIAVILFGNTIPMMYIRGIVKAKDEEIMLNFSDFYLMIHYVLIARANTSLSSIIQSYNKTTDSEEMHKFADACISLLDTYGEYVGPVKISERYMEIPYVVKLMRLIKQSNEGGDVVAELTGFRKEILDAKRYALEKRQDKIVKLARASFNILLPILVQAVISAMAIYFSDLSLALSFL